MEYQKSVSHLLAVLWGKHFRVHLSYTTIPAGYLLRSGLFSIFGSHWRVHLSNNTLQSHRFAGECTSKLTQLLNWTTLWTTPVTDHSSYNNDKGTYLVQTPSWIPSWLHNLLVRGIALSQLKKMGTSHLSKQRDRSSFSGIPLVAGFCSDGHWL